jgi:hypothetical protein
MAVKKRSRTSRDARATITTGGVACCIGGVCDPRRVQTIEAPAPVGTHTLANVSGPGLFLGGHVTKQGGNTGLTFIRLVIDGRIVVDITYAAARAFAFPAQNPYGMVLLSAGAAQNLTFGWPVPLVFRRSLILTAIVNERNVAQLVGDVIVGSVRC